MPEHHDTFRKLYGRIEHALKRADFLQDRQKAHADWRAFATSLTPAFFDEVAASGKANTLIREPPRVLNRDLQWEPEQPLPITTVEELFERGVCQIRHNILHYEKFARDRDKLLISEATWILELALAKSPNVQAVLPKE